MKNNKHAFTMIELIFVIVVLGILSAVAIPRLGGVTDDANYAQVLSTVSAIRTGIATEKQRRVLKGDFTHFDLDAATANTADKELFVGGANYSILQYPVYSATGKNAWMRIADVNVSAAQYTYKLSTTQTVTFTYDKIKGTFACNHANANCRLVQ